MVGPDPCPATGVACVDDQPGGRGEGCIIDAIMVGCNQDHVKGADTGEIPFDRTPTSKAAIFARCRNDRDIGVEKADNGAPLLQALAG